MNEPLFVFLLFVAMNCVSFIYLAGDRHVQVHQQDLPPADLSPDPSLQVDETERAQEEVSGLVSVIFHNTPTNILPLREFNRRWRLTGKIMLVQDLSIRKKTHSGNIKKQ